MTARIRALTTLHRLEERQLEGLARELTLAQGARAASEARISALGHRAATEARVTSPEALPYVGRFMAGLRREQSREQATCTELSGQIDVLRDQVMGHYKAGRSWEVLADRLKAERAAEALRKSEAALEDLTSARFGR